MYLAFDLYDTHHLQDLTVALHAWSDRFDIAYNTKIVRYIKRVTFDHDEHYTLFAVSWDNERFPYALIDQHKIDNP